LIELIWVNEVVNAENKGMGNTLIEMELGGAFQMELNGLRLILPKIWGDDSFCARIKEKSGKEKQ
jgi:hypothetical protein